MKELSVNGEAVRVVATTVDRLLAELGYDPTYVAVAVNRTCVKRRDFDSATVAAGDEVEILAPMAGG